MTSYEFEKAAKNAVIMTLRELRAKRQENFRAL